MHETYTRLTKVFQQVFDDDELEIAEKTTAADIEGWDSINHINLVVSVEREFKLRLTSSEVTSLKNVGDLAKLLDRKLGRSA